MVSLSTLMTKQCFRTEPMQFLCRDNFKSGKLKAIEFTTQGQLVPNSALYLYENQQPMAFMDWKQKQFIHFNPQGELVQRLDHNDYTHYENGESITHCINEKCSSQKWQFFKIDTRNLQIGDVIFSGNLSIYAGTGRAQFTHIAIFAGYEDGKPKVLGSDMSEKVQISDFNDSIYNTINYAVLRSEKFQNKVKDLLQSKAYRHQHFCSELFRTLVNRSFKTASNPINDFASIHPETLLQNNYQLFDVVDLKLQSQGNLPEFFKKRKIELSQQVQEWHQIVANPQDAIYQLFAKQFIFLPLVFSRSMMESMIRFSTSGVFKAPEESNPTNKLKKPVDPISQSKLQRCFTAKNNTKLCFHTDASSKLLSFEVLSKYLTPDWLIYLKDDQLSHYLKYTKTSNTYFHFDLNNNLKSRYINENYLEFEDNKVQLRCKGSDCKSTKHEWVQIDKSKLQVGDVLFTGSTHAYSGNQKSLISHVSIVDKTKNNRVFVLSNDIYKPIEIIPLKSLNKNLHTYFILRNSNFTKEFKKFRRNSPLHMAKLPYFCANLYFTIFKKAFPAKGAEFDEIQKNHAETIFFSTYESFNIIDYKTPSNQKLKDMAIERQSHLTQEREAIEYIMKSDANLLYRLIQSNLSLLPFTLTQKRVNDLLKFMQFYSD